MEPDKSKLKILTYQNYLWMIKASRDSQMFRRLYFLENNRKKDILKNGQLSCAFFVSSILKIFDLISCSHATIKGTVKDMKESGWQTTKKIAPGNVLVWQEKKSIDGEIHQHIGFYLGKNKAVSNSFKKGIPSFHHFTFGKNIKGQPKRKIVQILTHRIIQNKQYGI